MIHFKSHEDITIASIHATGLSDSAGVAQLVREVLAHIEGRPCSRLLLDFRHVRHLTSAALTELVRLQHTLRESGGELRLCGLRKEIYRVFEITNLDSYFTIHRDARHGVHGFLEASSGE